MLGASSLCMLSYSWSESFSELEETTGAAFLPLGLPTGFPVGFLLVSDCLGLREAIFCVWVCFGRADDRRASREKRSFRITRSLYTTRDV